MHLDAWLREGGRKGPLNPRTQAMYRTDLRRLEAWLTTRASLASRRVTKAVAGRYVTQEIVARASTR